MFLVADDDVIRVCCGLRGSGATGVAYESLKLQCRAGVSDCVTSESESTKRVLRSICMMFAKMVDKPRD